jgi:hypothetical protein
MTLGPQKPVCMRGAGPVLAPVYWMWVAGPFRGELREGIHLARTVLVSVLRLATSGSL